MTSVGLPIVAWCGAFLVAMTAFLLAVHGTGEEGVRAVIRHSAQTSIVLFVAAYAASSLRALWRTPASKWLLANRRYVGLSYAVSHTIHLAAIVALAFLSDAFRDGVTTATLAGGGLGYVFLFSMALTSSDRAVRWMGHRAWKALHTAGMHWMWFIFFISYAPRAVKSVLYVPFVLLLLAGVGLRFAARLRLRRMQPRAAA